MNKCISCGFATLGEKFCLNCIQSSKKSLIDHVNHPPHYNQGKHEVIDILEDKLSPEEFKGFLKGNILKYVLRADHKNGMEDYKKAQFYLNRLVEGK